MVLLRNPRFDLIVTLCCTALLGYFAWHAWLGPRGHSNISRLETELSVLQADLAEAQTRKQELEAKVLLMRPESVDADMLDELARSQLNWGGRDDLIVTLKAP